MSTLQNDLAPHAKVWIYQSSRKFNAKESADIQHKIATFVAQWTAHKQGVKGDGALLYDRFIVLMADETEVGVSGCSIDSSVHFIKGIGTEYKINFFDRWNIAYLKDSEVIGLDREEFEKLVDNGEIWDETIVFNNLVHTKQDLETKWQIPYAQSWIKNLLVAHTSFNSIL